MAIHSYVVIASLVVFALAYIALVVAGYSRNGWWGTGILFLIPVVIIPFLFLHWRRARYGTGLGVLGVLLFGLSILVQAQTERDIVLERPELGYRIVLPRGWHERSGKVKSAEFHVSELLHDQNFAVLKTNAANTLEVASTALCDYLGGRAGTGSPELRSLTLNGAVARECDVEVCEQDGCDLYIATTVQGPGRIASLLAWTSGADSRRRRAELLKVRDSFAWLDEAPRPHSAPS